MKFEEKIKKIEEIAEKLDNNDIPLEELISDYEKGIKLVAECREYLEKAEQKITELSKEVESN